MKKLLTLTSGLGLVIGLSACEERGQDREITDPTVTETPTAPEGQLGEDSLDEGQPDEGQLGQPSAGDELGQPAGEPIGQQGEPGADEVASRDPDEQGFWTDEGDPIERPDEYIGRRFVALAEVDEVVGPNFVRLNEPDWNIGDVAAFLTEGAKNTTLTTDDIVQIHGTVQRFTVAEVETSLGWDLDREVEVELENKPIVIIDKIKVVEREE